MDALTLANLRQTDEAGLQRITERYPWWTLPRLLAGVRGNTPCSVPVNPLCRPTPPAPESDPTRTLIATFLSSGGEHRIVPDAGTTDEDLSASGVNDDFPDDLITEELAEIYLAQGLTEQALDIYRRLSLLFPEKSVYFAEIIARNESKGKPDCNPI